MVKSRIGLFATLGFLLVAVSPEMLEAQGTHWTHPGQPLRAAGRFLGLGYGPGYHWQSPGSNSDYYSPYTVRNTHRIVPSVPTYPIAPRPFSEPAGAASDGWRSGFAFPAGSTGGMSQEQRFNGPSAFPAPGNHKDFVPRSSVPRVTHPETSSSSPTTGNTSHGAVAQRPHSILIIRK